MSEAQLRADRETLSNVICTPDVWGDLPTHWPTVKPLVERWWKALKVWEKADTFNAAFLDKRMTVRTFGADFNYQKSKSFDTITLPDTRFKADSQYTPMSYEDQRKHNDAFRSPAEYKKYHAQRGIDSSAFADPANFVSREKKYAMGLHDLSASLLNPAVSIFDQIHNNEEGAHFSFLPLSAEEDQLVLSQLTAAAKKLQGPLPEFYTLVRGYRAGVTRIKLAQEFDMAIGYTVVPAKNPTKDGPAYKLRYGLGNTMTIVGRTFGIKVTAEVLAARRQAAMRFKSILAERQAKNEIIIAIRQHAGNFPVYAVRKGNQLDCFTIDSGKLTLNGKKISANGVLA